MADSFLERVRRVAGDGALQDLGELDLSNELHVDRAATALLSSFRKDDDVEAFTLLVDLTQDRLAALAGDVARELGLAEDSGQLVVNFFEGLFVDLSASDGSTAFLGQTAAKMRENAEAWIRDMALADPHADPDIPRSWDDGQAQPRPPQADLLARVTRVCFHGLDLPFRRALRARDVEGLSPAEVGQRLELSPADAERLLGDATVRLAEAIDRSMKGGAR
jgi:hypothetical protein